MYALLILVSACAPPPPPAAPAAAAPPEVSPDAPLEPGELQVRLSQPGSIRAVEVACPDGYRSRATLTLTMGDTIGVGRLSNVPDQACELWFKGGTPAAYGPVRPGQDLRCTVQQSTALCTPAR